MSWVYQGFTEPNYTQIPDGFFDEVMCHVTDAELRVLLYIMRRTFGFKKRSDAISYNQFLRGIKTRDGRVLDEGCGLAGTTNLARALKGLEEKGLIVARRSKSDKGEPRTTIYELKFRTREVLIEREYPLPQVLTGREYPTDPGSGPVLIDDQLQETGSQERVHNRTDVSKEMVFDSFVDDVTQALGDELVAAANRTRARNLSEEFGAPAEAMPNYIAAAFKKTRARTDLSAPMAYFFTCLETILAQHHTRRARNMVLSP